MIDIEDFIRSVRDSFSGAEYVYMNGSCYRFAKILKGVYPEGELLENFDHVYFKLDHKYYDIRGEVYPVGVHQDLEKAKEPTRHGKFDLINFVREMRGR